MAVLKEVTITAKSVQEAFELGKEQLNVSETDDVQFEIIQQEAKKLFRAVPAIVRVYVEGPEPAKKEKPAEKPARSAAPKKEAAKPVAEHKPAREKQAEKPAPAARTEEIAPEEESRPRRDDAPQNPLVPVTEEAYSEQVKSALRLLRDILKEMNLEGLEFSVSQNENEAQISVTGQDASCLIGRRGETMSALQYLLSLAVNRKKDEYYRIMLNVEHYREKREKTLTALALRMARTAVRTGKSTTLEPMNPYERRIIHATVQQVEGAVSASVGEEPNRRVVIRSASGKPGSGHDRYDRRGNSRRPGQGGQRRNEEDRPRREERPRREYVAPRDENGEKREPKSDVDFGNLYGKIEL